MCSMNQLNHIVKRPLIIYVSVHGFRGNTFVALSVRRAQTSETKGTAEKKKKVSLLCFRARQRVIKVHKGYKTGLKEKR